MSHPTQKGWAQNFAFFFSLSRRKFRSFFSLWGVFSLNFGGVFEGRGAQMCTFGLSGCRVKPRRLWGPRGDSLAKCGHYPLGEERERGLWAVFGEGLCGVFVGCGRGKRGGVVGVCGVGFRAKMKQKKKK